MPETASFYPPIRFNAIRLHTPRTPKNNSRQSVKSGGCILNKFKHSRLAYRNNAMIHETLNPVKTDAYPRCCCPRLTDGRQSGKVVPAVFNQAASRRKLLQHGRQAVSFAHRAKAVFFTPASPPAWPFPHGKQGQGATCRGCFMLAVSYPLPFVCHPEP